MATEVMPLAQDDLNRYLAFAVKRERELGEALNVLGQYANSKFGTNNARRWAQQRVGQLKVDLDEAINQIEDLRRWGARI